MADPRLPSWREGAALDAIQQFLARVDEIPIRDRVAVFDNDGTLWAEKPNYTQLVFLMRELSEAVARDASLGDRVEYQALLNGDHEAVAELGLERVVMSLIDLHTGLEPREFDERVRRFFAEESHPERGVHYRGTRYQPMLELLDVLRAHDFGVYVVSGGGADFVRVISDDFYGVKPEGVVGSQIKYEFGRAPSGSVQLLRTAQLVATGPNEGPTKPTNIQRILGRQPCVAGGNSAGDGEMLEYAAAFDGPSLSLLVDHDDAEREYSYESRAGSFESTEVITDTAKRLDWTVISIANDWETVFANS